MKEQWKDVVGYSGYYEVSNLGRVCSVDRVARCGRTGYRKLKGRVLQSNPNNQDGHLAVNLSKEGIRRTIYVHRLVLAAWIGPCPTGQECRHGPNGVTDNSVSNLSYGTSSENGWEYA